MNFKGYQGYTEDQISAKRKMAEELVRNAMTGTPRNVPEGVNALASALIGRTMRGRLDATPPFTPPANGQAQPVQQSPRPQERPASMMAGAGNVSLQGGPQGDQIQYQTVSPQEFAAQNPVGGVPGTDGYYSQKAMESLENYGWDEVSQLGLSDALGIAGMQGEVTPAQEEIYQLMPPRERVRLLEELAVNPMLRIDQLLPDANEADMGLPRQRPRVQGGAGADQMRGQAAEDQLGTAAEVGSFGTDDATMNRRIQEANMNARAGLARLSNIDDILAENSDLLDNTLTFTGDMRRRWLSFRDRLGVEAFDINEDQEKELADSTAFRSAILRNVNRTIQEITGAAMGEQEAVRIRQELPDVNAGPTEFKAQLATAMNLLRLDIIRTRMWSERGGQGNASSISDNEVRQILKDKGRTYYEEALQSMSPVDARLEAARRLSEEYGL